MTTATTQDLARSAYQKLATAREPYLARARSAARLTIPALLPEAENVRSEDLPEPYQSNGARGVNNLTAKLLLSLFPVSAKFARLFVDKGELEANVIRGRETEVEQALAEIEDQLIEEFEQGRLRGKLSEAIRQLVVAGNVLLHIPPNGDLPRTFKLSTYVVERDPRGNIMRIIIKEMVNPLLLPDHLQDLKGSMDPETGEAVEVYTTVQRIETGDGPGWLEKQEVQGRLVRPPVIHEIDKLPYLALRWVAVDGESYGRSHVEEYIGSLRSMEGLSMAIHDGSLAASKLILLVDPDGRARLRKLAKAKSGDYVEGRKDDVTALQINKFHDFKVASDERDKHGRVVDLGFLVDDVIRRDAERVTAQEIRLMAQALDDILGGVFTQLSDDLQLPVVKLLMVKMQSEGRLEELPDFVKVKIVTGLDAIGRGHDLQRLDEFVRGATDALGDPAAVMQWLNVGIFLQQRATALGIPTDELVKSAEQIAQEQQQAQAQAAMEKLGPEAMRQFPEEVREAAGAMANQQQSGGTRVRLQRNAA